MTPNPESPKFKQNYIPENARENVKKIGEIFSQIKEDVRLGKWNGITSEDINLEYNTYNSWTKIKVKLTDNNEHRHHFAIQLFPDNGFGDGTDELNLEYHFEGELDENVLSIRSFADYLCAYLAWEGLEPKLTDYDELTNSNKRILMHLTKMMSSTVFRAYP